MLKPQDAFRSEDEHWFGTDRKFCRFVRSQPPALVAFSLSTGPSLSRTSSSRPRTRAPRGSRGSAIAIDRERSAFLTGRSKVRTTNRSRCPKATSRSPSSRRPNSPPQSRPPRPGAGRRPDSDCRVQDSVWRQRAGHSHGPCQLADGPERDARSRRVCEARRPLSRWRRSTTWSLRPSTPTSTAGSGRSKCWLRPDGHLYYRVYGAARNSKGELRAAVAHWTRAKPIVAFGGVPNMPMTITFQVDDYLPPASRSGFTSRSFCPRDRWATGSLRVGPR